jgi:biotin carboxyl carrier protein
MKRYRVTIDGRSYDVEIDDPRARPVTARLDGVVYTVDVQPLRTAADAVERLPADEGPPPTVRTLDPGEAEGALAPAASRTEQDGGPAEPGGTSSEPAGIPPHPIDAPAPVAAEVAEASPQTMTAPIPGVVASVVANVGQVVKRGDELLTLEAMKMFNVLRSPWAGTVTTLHVSKGEHVIQGQPLVTFGRR